MELALWTHYVASELKPELLDGIPGTTENGNSHATNGETTEPSDDSNQEAAVVANGKEPIDPAAIDDNSTTSLSEDSLDKPATPITIAATTTTTTATAPSEDTNDSIATNESNTRPTDTEDDTEDSQDTQEPPAKKSKK